MVRRRLRTDPAERYASARALLADLEPIGVPLAMALPPGGARLTPRWWWQFHQACAGCGYYAMLYPMWVAKKWFTSRFYPPEPAAQRRKTARWVRLGDWIFVLPLAASALSIHSPHATIATLLLSVAVGSLVAFTLIEPTTARAAFRYESGPRSRILDSSTSSCLMASPAGFVTPASNACSVTPGEKAAPRR